MYIVGGPNRMQFCDRLQLISIQIATNHNMKYLSVIVDKIMTEEVIGKTIYFNTKFICLFPIENVNVMGKMQFLHFVYKFYFHL